MPLTLLLDLDDTLLDTDKGAFLPGYYDSLARHLSPLVAPAAMLEALRSAVELMQANTDPARTLSEVFEAHFYPRIGVQPQALQAAVATFYSTVFPGLGRMARPMAGGRELVDWALAAGNEAVIATDPLFPLAATSERVRWAGLNPERFSLISAFETFHFSKSHIAYFAELLGRLGWPDRQMLMVGNDLERDLIPAQALGLSTFRAGVSGARPHRVALDSGLPDGTTGRGDLVELLDWLRSSSLQTYVPSFTTREAILAVLRATPAVLQSMTANLTPQMWRLERSATEWAMIELVCHLRDTEREVHAAQLSTLVESAVPFVSRPDAAVWAKQRRYLGEDGPASIREFVAARVAALNQLEALPERLWTKPARHAIFGPTTFLEVVGFMADHDRLHLQQAWDILHPVQAPAHPA
jgi:FMN phosphatase YigB (HAD superfamily)